MLSYIKYKAVLLFCQVVGRVELGFFGKEVRRTFVFSTEGHSESLTQCTDYLLAVAAWKSLVTATCRMNMQEKPWNQLASHRSVGLNPFTTSLQDRGHLSLSQPCISVGRASGDDSVRSTDTSNACIGCIGNYRANQSTFLHLIGCMAI